MKGALIFLVALGLALVIGTNIFLPQKREKAVSKSNPQTQDLQNMKLTSSAFITNSSIPSLYTCDGQNVNPPLTIRDVPTNAKSLVLVVDDPDAPAGTWVHWLIWNIAPDTKEIAQGSASPGSIEGTTSFGKPGYGGPCPPSGTHHYVFKLYALATLLNLPSSAKKTDLESTMATHILAESQLVGLYARK